MWNNNSYFYSGLPTRSERIQLSGRVSIGSDCIQFVHFEEDILWLRESQTTIQLSHGQRDIRTGPITNDFYGLGTSLEGIEESVEEQMEWFKITPESSLVVEVRFKLFETPVVKSPGNEESFKGHYKYYSTSSDWLHRNDEVEAHYIAATNNDRISIDLPWLREKIFLDNVLVWNSHSGQKIAEAVEPWIAKARDFNYQGE